MHSTLLLNPLLKTLVFWQNEILQKISAAVKIVLHFDDFSDFFCNVKIWNGFYGREGTIKCRKNVPFRSSMGSSMNALIWLRKHPKMRRFGLLDWCSSHLIVLVCFSIFSDPITSQWQRIIFVLYIINANLCITRATNTSADLGIFFQLQPTKTNCKSVMITPIQALQE